MSEYALYWKRKRKIIGYNVNNTTQFRRVILDINPTKRKVKFRK